MSPGMEGNFKLNSLGWGFNVLFCSLVVHFNLNFLVVPVKSSLPSDTFLPGIIALKILPIASAFEDGLYRNSLFFNPRPSCLINEPEMVHFNKIRISKFRCTSVSEACSDLANSTDSDEMLQNAAFHLGLHCLPITCLQVSRMKRVNP